MMTSTKRSRNVAVGTTNKSADAIWLTSMKRYVWEGVVGPEHVFAAVAWLRSMSRFTSSPWMRGAP
jgi:hypothetical protein